MCLTLINKSSNRKGDCSQLTLHPIYPPADREYNRPLL
jgi:hypothetical protein